MTWCASSQDLYIAFSGGAFPSGHFLTLISNLYTPKSRESLQEHLPSIPR